MPGRRLASCALLGALGLAAVGCGRPEDELRDHRTTLASLRSTARATAEAWIRGDVSRTYASVTFERAGQLVEHERTSVAKSPEVLADDEGARFSTDAERLSRVIARLTRDAHAADLQRARIDLAELTGIEGIESERP